MNERDLDHQLVKHAARCAAAFIETPFGVGDKFSFEADEFRLFIFNEKDLGETTEDAWVWTIEYEGKITDEISREAEGTVKTPDVALFEAWDQLVDAMRELFLDEVGTPMRAAGLLAKAFRDLPSDRAKTIAEDHLVNYSYLAEYAARWASSLFCPDSQAWNEDHSRFKFTADGLCVEMFDFGPDFVAECSWTITKEKSGRPSPIWSYERPGHPSEHPCHGSMFEAWMHFVELTSEYRNGLHFIGEALRAEAKKQKPWWL